MGKAILIIVGTFLLIGTCYFIFQNESSTQIRFKDNTNEVTDSLMKMEFLIKKFPKTGMVNYFIDNKGYLYLNNEKIALLKGAIYNPKVINDMVFEKFTKVEFYDFFNLIKFLGKNNITSCHYETIIGDFIYAYKEDSKLNYMSLIVIDDTTDISHVENEFKIVDRKGNLLLIVPDPKLHRYDDN